MKEEIIRLKSEIGDLKEQIKKSKRRVRDLELEIDFTLKETADILAEKDRGIAKMVEDYVKLKAQYNDMNERNEMVMKEKDMEMVALAESFEGRVLELEQLVESMRFTDRDQLVERIEGWKKAYERVCLDRDAIDNDLNGRLTIKESQLMGMAEEANNALDEHIQAKIQWQNELEGHEKAWNGKKAIMDEERRKLEEQIRNLDTQLMKKQKELEKALMISDAPSDNVEIQRLEKELKEKEHQIAQIEQGYALLVEEHRDMTEVQETANEGTEAIHDDYKEQLEAKDKEMAQIMREHKVLQKTMEEEVYVAQQACRAIEERIKKFPNPFEIEVREMKDKFAQMQAGMVNLSLENVNLRDKVDTLRRTKEEHVNHLEKQLKDAMRILKDVAGTDLMASTFPNRQMSQLETELGVDLNGDGRIG